MTSLRSVVLTSIATTVLALPATASAADGVRVLTWNTAFLYMKALPPDVAGLPCLQDTCDPIDGPPVGPPGCLCDHMAMYPNDGRFNGTHELARANYIADRILATDQEIVVLNEVFNPMVRFVLEMRLATLGPYSHYISRLRGHAPTEGLTLFDIAKTEAPDWLPILQWLPDLPAFMDYTADPGDSGLMVFSKLPFETLEGGDIIDDTSCGDEVCEVSGRNDGGPIAAGDFAFNVFEACNEADCWASKGVGLVRVATPNFDVFVAFTHMQADYPAEDEFFRETRAKQLDEIRSTIVGAIPDKKIADAFVVLAGDLNVVGAEPSEPQIWPTQEWYDVFDPDSANGNVSDDFFACANGIDTGGSVQPCRFGVNGSAMLSDPVGFRHSPGDDFITNDTDDARLDYLAASHGGGRICPQHMHIAYDLMADVDGARAWLSDHVPVRGDFAPSARHCSPSSDDQLFAPLQNVRTLEFGTTDCAPSGPNPACKQDELVTGTEATLARGGSMQWFLIEQAGSYSIDTDSFDADADVSFDVYHHTDLSRPLEPFDEDEGEQGIPFSLPDPPYYIRTFATDASGNPDRDADQVAYQLQVHQHLCRSPLDACFIDPGQLFTTPYEYTFPSTVDVLSEVRDLWFRFKTASVANGAPATKDDPDMRYPDVDFFLEAGGSESHDCMTKQTPVFQSWNNPTSPTVLEEEWDYVDMLVEETIGSWDGDADRDERWVAPELPTKVKGELAEYFVRITRDARWDDPWNLCNPKMSATLAYDTNLSFFAPQKLVSWNTYDGDPELLLVHSGFDATWYADPPPFLESVPVLMNELDDASTVGLAGVAALRGYYVDELWPTLWSADADDLIKATSHNPGGHAALSPMQASDAAPWYTSYTDNPDPEDADYLYYYYAATCHLEKEQACAVLK